MLIGMYSTADGSAYIAGANDGIVTVRGSPASRRIWLLNAKSMAVEQVVKSLNNGHYIFLGLNPDKDIWLWCATISASLSHLRGIMSNR